MSRTEVEFKTEMVQILNKVAEIKNIKSYETEIDTSILRGEGLMGDLIFGSVVDKANKKVLKIAVKKIFPSEALNKRIDLSAYYEMENYFYKEVFPKLDLFQRNRTSDVLFSSIPRYYFGISDYLKEAVVMEDLRHEEFKLFDRSKTLDDDHMRLIFQEYAKFHALALSFKDQNPEEYCRLCSKLKYNLVIKLGDLEYGINNFGTMIYNNFSSGDNEDFAEKLKKYSTNAFGVFTEAYLYNGRYSTFIHGNSRLNNIMFKYNEIGQLERIKILDFQTLRIGSPVHDLAYIFYDGGSKELFSKLYDFLDVYYETFSNFSVQLGSNPEKIYPKSVLKEEWKKCAKCGFFTGVIHAKLQNVDKNKLVTAIQSTEKDIKKRYQSLSKNMPAEQNSLFLQKLRDLIDHAREYDIL